jgi:hypothetical protein
MKSFFFLLLIIFFTSSKPINAYDPHPNKLIAEKIRNQILNTAPSEWMIDQINDDLDFFNKNTSQFLTAEEILKKDQEEETENLLMRIQFINKKLKFSTSKVSTQANPRYKLIQHHFKKLIKLSGIKDFDVIVSLHDSLSENSFMFGPILTFARNINDQKRLLIPDFEALEGNTRALQEVRKGNFLYPWDSKVNVGFWRGAMTGGFFSTGNFLNFPRSQCIYLSLMHPEILDAKFTQICQCDNPNLISGVAPIKPDRLSMT